MLYINPESERIQKAKKFHFDKLSCYVSKKLGRNKNLNCQNGNECEICNSQIEVVDDLQPNIVEFVDKFLEVLLTGSPEDLLNLYVLFLYSVKRFDKEFIAGIFEDTINSKDNLLYLSSISEIKILKNIFSYSWFSRKNNPYYNTYDLSSNLSIRTCVYCNRIYTNTVYTDNGIGKIRPQFDHWFPQKYFPLFGISFYNLIPSCSYCNSSIKGEKIFDLNSHIHPYIKSESNKKVRFGYKAVASGEYEVDLKGEDDKSKKIIWEFSLKEIYKAHNSELNDLIRIKAYHPDFYLQSIERMFESHFSKEEMYRTLFCTEMMESEFHKKPLSKFKSDIIKKLNLI